MIFYLRRIMTNKSWIIKAFLLTFIITILISGLTNTIVVDCNFWVLLIITIIIIFLGIIFDIIGTAVLTANEASFHAKASNKIKGAFHYFRFVRKPFFKST